MHKYVSIPLAHYILLAQFTRFHYTKKQTNIYCYLHTKFGINLAYLKIGNKI